MAGEKYAWVVDEGGPNEMTIVAKTIKKAVRVWQEQVSGDPQNPWPDEPRSVIRSGRELIDSGE